MTAHLQPERLTHKEEERRQRERHEPPESSPSVAFHRRKYDMWQRLRYACPMCGGFRTLLWYGRRGDMHPSDPLFEATRLQCCRCAWEIRDDDIDPLIDQLSELTLLARSDKTRRF